MKMYFLNLFSFWESRFTKASKWKHSKDVEYRLLSLIHSQCPTLCLKGHERSASYSPFIMTKKREMCVPFPTPSPYMYRRMHTLNPYLDV